MAKSKIEILLTPHEDIKERADDMELYRRSYVGGSAFTEGGYLIKHPLETRRDFKNRKSESTFVNYSAPMVDILNSYLYRENPKRVIGDSHLGKTANVAIQMFWENADLRGRGYASLMKEIGRWASVYGYMGIIVDKPISDAAVSRAEELQYGIRPYISYYKPTDIINWEYEANYNGPPVLTTLVLREPELVENESVFRIWRRDTWELWKVVKKKTNAKEDEPPRLIDTGENRLGIVPFVLFRNKDDLEEMSGVSDLVDIAPINRRIFRYDSAALEIINRTAFPFLEVPVDSISGSNDKPVVIGVGNALERDLADTIGHRWVEPSHESLTNILEWRRQSVLDIRETAKIGGVQLQQRQGSGVASGPALEVRFQQLNSILAAKAGLYEQGEENILRLVVMWEDLSDSVDVRYPRKFGIRDIVADLDTAIRAKDVILSPVYDKLVQKALAAKTLTDFGYSGDDITRAGADIDAHEYVPSPRTMQNAGGMNGTSVVQVGEKTQKAQADAIKQAAADNISKGPDISSKKGPFTP